MIGIMIRMLMVGAADPVQHLGIVGVGRSLARHLDQVGVPGHPALVAVLVFGRRAIGLVEGADQNSYVVTIGIVEGEWGATVTAKTTSADVRAAKIADRATRQAKCGLHHRADDRERTAHSLLAHPAVADMDVLRGLLQRVPHGATLAATS